MSSFSQTMVIVTDWNALVPNCLIAKLPNCLIAYHKDVHSTSLLMIIQGEHLGTGAGTGTTRQANSTWKMRVQKSIYKSKSSQFTCRTQKWFFVILWWLSTQRAIGNGYNGNLLPPLPIFPDYLIASLAISENFLCNWLVGSWLGLDLLSGN